MTQKQSGNPRNSCPSCGFNGSQELDRLLLERLLILRDGRRPLLSMREIAAKSGYLRGEAHRRWNLLIERYPTHYQAVRGGEWLCWVWGELDEPLRVRHTGGNRFKDGRVVHKGHFVYAFAFMPTWNSKPRQHDARYPQWNCVQGWTTTVKESRFILGTHIRAEAL